MSKFHVLKKEGIKNYRKDIRQMSKEQLLRRFSTKTTKKPIAALIIKNIIWQTYRNIKSKKEPKLEGNIRSFWYSHIKPVLGRVGLLTKRSDHYQTLSDALVELVYRYHLFRYKDFGFEDENNEYRKLGKSNSHIILFSEKHGHYTTLRKLADEVDITAISLGGQPSALSSEYFIDEMKKIILLTQTFYLFSVVDFDPSGDWISRTFITQLKSWGIKGIRLFTLVSPYNVPQKIVKLHRYPLSRRKSERTKNLNWLRRTYGIDGKYFGLEADAISRPTLRDIFLRASNPYLVADPHSIATRKWRDIIRKTLKQVILKKLGL